MNRLTISVNKLMTSARMSTTSAVRLRTSVGEFRLTTIVDKFTTSAIRLKKPSEKAELEGRGIRLSLGTVQSKSCLARRCIS